MLCSVESSSLRIKYRVKSCKEPSQEALHGLSLLVTVTSVCHLRELVSVYIILSIVSWLLLQSHQEWMARSNKDFHMQLFV